MTLREVRDPIHGLIELEPAEWAVVDTPAFQRLRGVQQLAMTHLVYPGARHSRFEHCIGASHIAGRIAASLTKAGADLDESRVRLAALTHDIGHGPFSHVSEEVFEELTGRSNIHESLSAAIVTLDPNVAGALGEETGTWIKQLLLHEGFARRRTVERDIVSGPADIDKLDYLLRDSHFCGVNYGKYDLAKVIESARRHADTVGDSYLAFNEDGLFALEEMLLARYHMHRQVYGHKTRIGIDRMLVRAMVLGVEEGLLPQDVFAPPQDIDVEFVRSYLRWTDSTVVRCLCDGGLSPASELMRALVDRRLCKCAISLDAAQLHARWGDPALFGCIVRPDQNVLASFRPRVEAAIAEVAGVDPHWVFLYWLDQKSQISLPGDTRVTSKDILILRRDGPPEPFHATSEIFTQETVPSEVSIHLYLRTRDDGGLHGPLREATLETFVAGLEEIGRATAAL